MATTIRRKARASHEEELVSSVADDEEDGLLFPTAMTTIDHISAHRTALIATFIIAIVWFAQVIDPLYAQHASEGAVWAPAPAQVAAPPMLGPVGKAQGLAQFLATGNNLMSNDGPGFRPRVRAAATSDAGASGAAGADKGSFVFTCALVHTVIVGVGLGLGRDTRLLTSLQEKVVTMGKAYFGCYTFLALALYVAWEYDVGPVPGAFAHTPGVNTASFVLLGALSMSMWLGCSMLVPHSGLGDKAASSTSLHVAIAAAGLCLTIFDASVTASLACFVLCGSAGVLANSLPTAQRRAASLSWGSF